MTNQYAPFRLKIWSENANINNFNLFQGIYSIGNLISNEIYLNYPTVSKNHGKILIGPSKIQFIDEISRNGSLLFRKRKKIRLKKKMYYLLKNEDILKIGPFQLQIIEQNPIEEDVKNNGPLDSYLKNSSCQEIMVNGPDEIYVDFGKGPIKIEGKFLCKESYTAWIQKQVTEAGRRLDQQNPLCEGTLLDGSRIQAVLSPIAKNGAAISIRRFPFDPNKKENPTSHQYDTFALNILQKAVLEKRNIIIAGGTGAGKTTLLNTLCQFIPKEERIITIEDTAELQLPNSNLVTLQARKANSDHVGEVSLRTLMQTALRMRPDRIIVGECRGAEVIEMLQAMNTGHPGSLCTVHANSCEDTLQRLCLLMLMHSKNMNEEMATKWLLNTIEFLVFIQRDSNGRRFISEIAEVKNGETIESIYLEKKKD